MGLSLSNVRDAFTLVPLIISSIKMVDRLFHKDPSQTQEQMNKTRQDAAVEGVKDLLPLIEGAIDRDVVDDELVQAALRKEIDATVALFNVVRDVKAKRALAAAHALPTASSPLVGGTPD